MNFQIWFLIGVALVFFMQCGFAMLEVGFIRAKNAANIIMKNLMDLVFGAISFLLLGYCLLTAEDYLFGIVGVPNSGIFTNYADFNYSNFIFNLVFCATAATIVSGAMAERTKFSAYCIYSIVISAVIYPIEAGWVWNANGWLYQLGFIDFAGSGAIHMAGGICALVGAAFVGPRVGKYGRDSKVNAIPGHNITISALGVFILWFGWYGFNGAAAGNIGELGSIFVTTTISACAASVTAMIFSKLKNGKPDVSMTLNGVLAGLVGITAGCANVDAAGAFAIGLIAGIITVPAIEFIDTKLRIDDPVGAVAVHGVCGLWGTIAVGLFAVPAEGLEGGLFYSGSIGMLKVQVLGVLAIAVWIFITIGITFFLLKKINGLRASVSRNEELAGLDATELGTSSYADFITVKPESFSAAAAQTNSIKNVPQKQRMKITKVTIVIRQSRLEDLKTALNKIGVSSMTVTDVFGCDMNAGSKDFYRGVSIESGLLPRIKIDVVISGIPLAVFINTVKKVLYTGIIGDGKIFVYDVENAVKVRTGEEGYDALQDKI
ncbi:MAG: ammonium transporter [Treponema sp.]|nr:ammonium transporter [Treponema sp.]